jgi:hypothetical protein
MSEPAEDIVDDVEHVDEHEPTAEETAALAHYEQLQTKLRNGANWFYWIAALSVVNSFILLADGDRQFVVGLGISQFVNAVAIEIGKQHPDAAVICKIVAGVFTCVTAGIFAAFGLGSRKRYTWVFVCGMLLYSLDGLLFLVLQDWFSFGFHIFALFGIFGGFSACRQLNALDLELAEEGV